MTEKRIRWTALANGVIAVAKEGEIKDWAAYIGKTEGNNHNKEFTEILKDGTKLDYRIAKAIFPDFAQQFAWRG